MDCKILAWDIRGAMSASAKRHLKEILGSSDPWIIFLFETHLEFAKVKDFLDRLGFAVVHISEAKGHAGGIWCLRTVKHQARCSVAFVHDQAVTIRVDTRQVQWFFSGVYASPVLSAR